MKTLSRIALQLLVVGLFLSLTACSGETAEQMAEEACDRQLECEEIDEDAHATCVSEAHSDADGEEEEVSDECWDASVALHHCTMEVSCEDREEDNWAFEACGDEFEEAAEHCL